MASEHCRKRQPIRAGTVRKPDSVVPGLFGPLCAGNIVFQRRAFGQGYGNMLPWDHQRFSWTNETRSLDERGMLRYLPELTGWCVGRLSQQRAKDRGYML
jgi:hypothetical protein